MAENKKEETKVGEEAHGHDHAHGEGHDHAHDHENDHDDDGHNEDGHKASKGEKRFKKTLIKSGAVTLDTVKRVTMKTNKNFVMYIDKPSILKTGEKEDTYIIFGEPKFLDFKNQMAGNQAAKFAEGAKASEADGAKTTEIKKEEEEDNGEDEVLKEGEKFTEADVEHVIKFTSAKRNRAIRVLREKEGDLVEAITALS